MSVESILKKKGTEVATIAPDASVKRAADWLRAKHIGALVVTRDNTILGLVSEREIVLAISRHGEAATSMSVSEIMRHGVITVSPTETVGHVMDLMTRHRARHMPVVQTASSPGSSASATWSNTVWTICSLKPASCATPTSLHVSAGLSERSLC